MARKQEPKPDVVSQRVTFAGSTKNYHKYMYGERFPLYIGRDAFPHDSPPAELYFTVRELQRDE